MRRSIPDGLRSSRFRSVGAMVVALACVASAAVLAVRSPGYAGSSVTATTRVVWVTNAGQFLLGRINRQIDELDSAASLSSPDFDVLQDGREVVAVDRAAHQLRLVDPASVTLSEPLDIPDHAVVALGGGVLAVGDVATGRVWRLPAAHPGTGKLADRAPAATVAPGVVLAVGTDGSVAATAPGRNRLTIIGGSGGGAGDTATSAVGLGRTLSAARAADPAPIGIAMVGARPVVLDRPAGVVIAGRRAWPLPDGVSGAVLQQSGPPADAVLLATDTALLRVSLADGQVGTIDTGSTGPAAAPVWLNGCAHGAWSGVHPTYLAWCGADPTIRPIPLAGGRAPTSLVFRVNGDEIALNDIATGNTWLLNDRLTVINNWSQVAPPRDENPQRPDNSGNENESRQSSLSRTNCSAGITPPAARDDSFGVRAGRPAVLPVMDNDATTDCSAVAVESVSGWQASDGAVSVVHDGRALQVTAAADRTGALPALTYRLSDGAGHTSQATVRIDIVPDDQHPRPRRLQGSATVVGVGGTVTDNVLADWYSPAGDPLWLTAVSAQGQDLVAGFEPGGAITVHDTGTGGPGKRTVTFALTDGVNVEHGTLSVQVVSDNDASPLASPVFASTTVRRPVTLRLLDSVLVPGTDPARITRVTADTAGGRAPAGLQVGQPTDAGTVTIGADRPGDYRLHYQVTAGPLSARGVIRVRVVAGSTGPPVAVTDVGYLAPDGDVRLDLTGNDLDGGRTLAVRSVQLGDGSPLVVTLTDMHVAHISARRPLPAGGSWFSYTASDGTAQTTGWVHVVPVQDVAGQGPVASPARMMVRAGDAGTLPIGTVAQDRDGNAMRVQPFPPLPAGQGLLFASGDTIRYLAPATPPPSTISTVYTVTDTAGRSDSSTLHITVLPRGPNRRPSTPPVATLRVFAGGTATVTLPLDGIDPDGDWVTVSSIAAPGTLGTASRSGPESIQYTALDRTGSDTVTYTAEDSSGASVTGRVQVVIVPPPKFARPPVAPDLNVSVAPGRSIGVDALAAVSDPAGLPVRFAPGGGAIRVPARSGLTARIAEGVLLVKAGTRPAVVPVGYTVVNSRDLRATGVVTVTVTPDAQPIPPTASDVFVTPTMVSTDGLRAVVDLSDHVSNPGGLPADLEVGLPAVNASAASRTGRLQVTVPLTGRRQVLAYKVTNGQDQSASAFIVVPKDLGVAAVDDGPARPDPLAPDVRPLTVDAGKANTVDIRAHVTGARPGGSIVIPDVDRPTASVGDVSRQDATHLRWTVPGDARGQGWLSTKVTDGRGGAVRVRIPATIRPAVPPAPKFQSTAVDVAAGGTATVDLAALVTPGAEGQHLTYAGPTGAGRGVTATLSGSTLRISARGTAAKGSPVDLGVSVTDGVHAPVAATVRVRVVASTAPPAWVPDVKVGGRQGVRKAVDVLAAATNPVPDLGPLRLVAATRIRGDGSVNFTAGGTVSITPAADQVGPLTVRVSVQDATGDPDRLVTATVTVTVVGRPGRVTGVDVVDTGDRFVELKWIAPPDNGRPITSYIVRATSGGYHRACDANVTRCRLTGLTNNTAYRFTVTARNGVGDAPASAPSPRARPDVAPDAPAAPTLSFGDGTITATWKPPADRGSPVSSYLVTISPAPRDGPATARVTDGTTYTFGHLVNGTSYQVTVIARNASGTDSDPSAPATMVPAAPPDVPQAPGLTYDDDAGTVTASWKAVNGNGDDEVSYRLRWAGDDGTDGTVTVRPGRPLSATISGAKLGVTYSATVTAINKAGPSGPGPAGTVRAFTAVGAPSDVTATATGEDHTVTVTWSAPAFSGWDISGYRYQIDGSGTWNPLPPTTSTTIHNGALSNGEKHTVSIRACTQQAADACGQGATSNEVVPYGPIGAPIVKTSDRARSSVTFTWQPPADNGLGPYTYRLGGDASGTTNDTSKTVGTACGTTASISVVAVDSQGHVGAAGTASGTASACPPSYPTGTVTHAGAPTFASLYNLVPDGNLGPYGSAQIKCWNPAQLIRSDHGDGWFKLASGVYAGQWTAANNFQNWGSLKNQVAGTPCPKT